MTLETFPVELAPFYDTAEAQEDLLNDALASGHAGYIANALGIIARARADRGRLNDAETRAELIDPAPGNASGLAQQNKCLYIK